MMSDSSRLGVSTGHREPQRTEVLYERTITVALGKTQWMATQSAAPSQLRRPLPNFSVGGEQPTETQHVPQDSKPGRATGLSEHPLADCMLPDPGPWEVLYFSTWTYKDRQRERTSRGGFGTHSEKAWTGRGRLQDRTHRSTLPHQPGWHTGRRQRGKAWASHEPRA